MLILDIVCVLAAVLCTYRLTRAICETRHICPHSIQSWEILSGDVARCDDCETYIIRDAKDGFWYRQTR